VRVSVAAVRLRIGERGSGDVEVAFLTSVLSEL
jgi:hypothetical protein